VVVLVVVVVVPTPEEPDELLLGATVVVLVVVVPTPDEPEELLGAMVVVVAGKDACAWAGAHIVEIRGFVHLPGRIIVAAAPPRMTLRTCRRSCSFSCIDELLPQQDHDAQFLTKEVRCQTYILADISHRPMNTSVQKATAGRIRLGSNSLKAIPATDWRERQGRGLRAFIPYALAGLV
jgi:hypothetical protein